MKSALDTIQRDVMIMAEGGGSYGDNYEEIILCDCHSVEHQVIFRGIKDDDALHPQREVYVEVHLNTNKNFFKRLWVGIKFAFGYQSRYGAWDEVIISQKDLPKLKKLIEFLEKK